MPTLHELQAELNAKRDQLRGFIAQFPTKLNDEGRQAPDIPADRIQEIRDRNEELNKLGEQVDALRGIGVIDAPEVAPKKTERGAKDLLGQLRESAGASDHRALVAALKRETGLQLLGIGDRVAEKRAVMTTTSGFAPEIMRDAPVVPAISQPMGLLPFLAVVPTDKPSTAYMQQTTRTIPAEEVNEDEAAPEATILYTEQTAPVRRISVLLPVTMEQIEDETDLQAILESDLMLAVMQRLDRQVTIGNGTAPNLLGLYDGAANGYARGTNGGATETIIDAGGWALNTVITANGNGGLGGSYANPNLVLLNSVDLTRLALAKTADGIYLYGSPADTPITRLWGVNVARSPWLTAGTGLVADTASANMRVRMRRDATIYISDSDGNDFERGAMKLRCDIRAGFEIRNPQAACRMTNLTLA